MTATTTARTAHSRLRALAIPAGLFAGALVVRLAMLGEKSLWFDEVLSLDDAASVRQRFGSGFHPPVYYTVLYVWTRLVGDSDVAIRLTAALPGALTVPVVYGLGYRLFGHREGLAAALLLGVASLHVEFSQEARMYALATLFVTVAALLLAECVRREPAADPRQRFGWPLAFTLVAYLAAGTHYLTIPALIGLACALLVDARRLAPLIGRLALLQVPALVGALVFVRGLGYGKQLRAAALFAGNLGGVNQTIFDDPATQLLRLPFDLFMQILPGLSVKWLVISDFRWPAAAVVDLAIVAGTFVLLRSVSIPRIHRALVLLPATLSILITVFMVGAGQLRFYVVASPFVFLATGAGLVRLERFRLGPILLVATLAVSVYATWTYLFFPLDKQPWRAVGTRVQREARPGDVVLVTEPHLKIAFDRYFDPRDGVEVSPFPEEGVKITPERLDLFLKPLVRKARRVWFVQGSATASHADPEGLARAWLASNFRLEARLLERGYNGDVDISLYER